MLKLRAGRLNPGVIFWLLCCCVPTRAQYRFDHWTADSGLPQNSVYAIKQTQDGYLWLTTSDGLARFDGVRFTVFNKSNTPGISNNRFQSLYEDPQGDLWLGTEDGGVVRRQQGRFVSYGIERGLMSPFAQWVMGDAKGQPLVLTPGRQIVRWTGERFEQYAPENLPVPGFTRGVQAFPCYPAPRETACFVRGRMENLSRLLGQPDKNWDVLSTAQDPQGVLWVITGELGLAKIEPGQGVKLYTTRDGLPGHPLELVLGARLALLSLDAQGALWLTDLQSFRHQVLSRHPPDTLTGHYDIRVAYEDREGNLWFGSFRNGLFRARRQLITTYSQADGLAQNNVYPVFEDRQGAVWAGTTRGLFKLQDGRATLVAPDLDVSALAADAAGRVLAARLSTLYLFERGRPTQYFEFDPLSTISALHFARDGALWLGSNKGLGRLQEGKLTLYTTKDGLAGDNVKVILPDRGGGLWLGTYGGLSHWQDGRFRSWTEKDGLPSRAIRALYQDADGVLWIGTYDGGLGRFQAGRFTRYNTNVGLFNDGVFQILEDARHNFWLSCNRGIYRVSKQELNEYAAGQRTTVTSIAYGKSDGLLSAECNGGRQPAGVQTRDGKLWFPTQDGVAVIDPATVNVNPQPPPVVIENLRVDNAAVPLADAAPALRIAPQQANFEIAYTALSFINSENLRFRYQLAELDHDWVEAGTRRTAYFSHVPPGTYTFRVTAANSDGVWNEQGASLRVVVVPPFYRRWWFVVLALASVLGLAALAYQARIRQLTRAKAAQEEFSRRLIESQEHERKRIAAELHDGLGQNLLIIKNRALLGGLNADGHAPSQEQFNEISTSVSQAIEEVREIAYDLRPFHLDRLGLTQTIEAMVERVAAASGIAFTIEVPPLEGLFNAEAEINLYRVIQEAVNNIARHSGATAARVNLTRETRQLTMTIEDNGRGLVNAEQSMLNAESALTPHTGGFGLTSIAERVRFLGGTHTLESVPGQGVTLIIQLSLV